jgi:type IV fimbrial biogenesis protein FimT
MQPLSQRGFTIVELMIVLIILGILVVMAAPSFVDTLDRRRVINATQALTAQVQQARSIAVTRNRDVSLVITQASATDWCFGLTDAASCDCTLVDQEDADACTVGIPDAADPSQIDRVLVRADQAAFPGVTLTMAESPMTLTFEPTRGIRRGGGGDVSMDFESPRDLQTRVTVGRLGRVSTCSPSGATLLAGIEPCPVQVDPPAEEEGDV